MVLLSSLPGRAEIKRLCRLHFLSHGWSTNEFSDDRIDLDVSMGNLRFLLTCIDTEMQRFLSGSEILSRIEKNVTEFKLKRDLRVVTVLNFRFAGSSFSEIARRRVAVLNVDELEVVTSLADVQDGLPDELESRQSLLLEGNIKFCTAISQRYHKSKNLSFAIVWAQHAIRGNNGFSAGYQKLVDLLLEADNIEEAKTVALEALDRRPKDRHALKVMHKIATKQNDSLGAERWAGLLKKATEGETVDFEWIIHKQKRAKEVTVSQVAEHSSTQESFFPGGGLAASLKRLIVRFLK